MKNNSYQKQKYLQNTESKGHFRQTDCLLRTYYSSNHNKESESDEHVNAQKHFSMFNDSNKKNV